MKIKEGRRASHSYSSQTHGPRRTTHGTSGEHPWWRGDSRRSILPPTGCREEVFWCSRSWKRGGGATDASSRNRVPLLEFSRDGGYIGERGQPEVVQGPQAPPWRDQGWGRARWPPGPPLAPLCPLSGSSRSFLHADFLSVFSRIFLALFIWQKTEIEKQQKTGTGTGVHGV